MEKSSYTKFKFWKIYFFATTSIISYFSIIAPATGKSWCLLCQGYCFPLLSILLTFTIQQFVHFSKSGVFNVFNNTLIIYVAPLLLNITSRVLSFVAISIIWYIIFFTVCFHIFPLLFMGRRLSLTATSEQSRCSLSLGRSFPISLVLNIFPLKLLPLFCLQVILSFVIFLAFWVHVQSIAMSKNVKFLANSSKIRINAQKYEKLLTL